MSFLDHLRACNCCDLSRYRRFIAAGVAVGWVRHDFAEHLLGFPEIQVGDAAVALVAEAETFAARSAALDRVAARLVAAGVMRKLRREKYAVAPRWGAPPLLAVDRGAVPFFGVSAYGLHVNGYVRRPDGSLALWIARRARDRAVAPGKLDNLVAGGLPVGLSLAENLVKEAAEEADIPAALAQRSVPVGMLSYMMDVPEGVKPDVMFLYDLELPADFVPRNTDGEVEDFRLYTLDEVAHIVETGDDFKFNCNLVILDFLIRHGHLGPDHPDYVALVQGLRRPGVGGFPAPWGDGP